MPVGTFAWRSAEDVPELLDGGAGHFFAGLGAFAAEVGALLHHGVAVCELVACGGALVADFGALGAEVGRVLGVSGHEAGDGVADVGAVVHEALVLGGGVLAAHVQAVEAALQTHTAAFATELHAIEGFAGGHIS